jgi:hypothetical protein
MAAPTVSKTGAVEALPERVYASLSPGDERRRLADALRAAPAGSPLGQVRQVVIGLARDGGFSLRDLPVDVARAVLKSQGDAMQALLDGWSKSIAENAAADRQADQRRLLAKAQLHAGNVIAGAQADPAPPLPARGRSAGDDARPAFTGAGLEPPAGASASLRPDRRRPG